MSSNWNASKLPTHNGYVWATAKERAISEWGFSSKPPCVEVSRINGIARTTLGSVAGRALVGALPVVASEVNQVIFCSFSDTKQREHWGVNPKLASENHCKCVMFHFIAMFHHVFFRDRRFMKVPSSQFDVWWKLPQGEPTRRGPSSQWLLLYCVLAAAVFMCRVVGPALRLIEGTWGEWPNGHVYPIDPSCLWSGRVMEGKFRIPVLATV